MIDKLIIASRQSQLALVQANFVKNLIEKKHDIKVEILPVKTKGDKILDVSLSKIGGKGLFVKELENLLLSKKADIAVHSMKDMPSILPPGLKIGAILERETPLDAFVSNKFTSIAKMDKNSIIGTSSLRRKCQVLENNKHVKIKDLRGNVDTRLKKLDNNEFDGIILAAAGLTRLNLSNRITEILTVDEMLPACGQGALGIECRSKDKGIESIIKDLNHIQTYNELIAEREVNKILDAGCQAPIAAFAITQNNQITLKAKAIAIDNSEVLFYEKSDHIENAKNLGQDVAENLLAQGAKRIIDEAKAYFNN